jgi:hypothetical protein
MTGPPPATPPGGDDLTARVFRALYQDFDLHQIAGIHIAVPKGAPCCTGPSLAAIARQISARGHPAPAAAPGVPPPLPARRTPPWQDPP